MAREQKESMVEHRVTVAVRYPLSGGVPTLEATTSALTETLIDALGEEGATYDADVVVVKAEAKHIRVPVKADG